MFDVKAISTSVFPSCYNKTFLYGQFVDQSWGATSDKEKRSAALSQKSSLVIVNFNEIYFFSKNARRKSFTEHFSEKL